MKGAIITIMFSLSLNSFFADSPEIKLKEVQSYEFYGERELKKDGANFTLSFRNNSKDSKYPIDAVIFEKQEQKGKKDCINFYYWKEGALVGWILEQNVWIRVPEESRNNIESMLKGLIDQINEAKFGRAAL